MSITIQNSSIDASASQLSVNVNNGSSSASLVAKPDGTLQYANKNIVKSINGIRADASGNVNISTSGNLPFSNGTIRYISDGCSDRRNYTYTANCNCFIYLLVSYSDDSYGLESYRFTVKANNTVLYSGGNRQDNEKIMYVFLHNGQTLTVSSNIRGCLTVRKLAGGLQRTLFNLSGSVGKTLSVTFDLPPPTRYL